MYSAGGILYLMVLPPLPRTNSMTFQEDVRLHLNPTTDSGKRRPETEAPDQRFNEP